jgi:hypothetical protein
LLLNNVNLKQLNFKIIDKLMFGFHSNFLLKKRFLINTLTKSTKNILNLKYYKFLYFLFYKLNYFSKLKKGNNNYSFFRKFKTLKNSGLVFNKNKFANLFLLNTKPEFFNVLNLRKKLYYNSCLNN